MFELESLSEGNNILGNRKYVVLLPSLQTLFCVRILDLRREILASLQAYAHP